MIEGQKLRFQAAFVALLQQLAALIPTLDWAGTASHKGFQGDRHQGGHFLNKNGGDCR